MRLFWISILSATLASSCATRLQRWKSLGEEMRSEGIRNIVVSEDFSIFSPFEEERTQQFADMAKKAMKQLTEIFGCSRQTPVVIRLQPGEQKITKLGNHTLYSSSATVNGIGGWHAGGAIVVYYAPEILGMRADPAKYANTLRHELTHAWIEEFPVKLPHWLDEGVANEFEAGTHDENGKLQLPFLFKSLAAAKATHSRHSITQILDQRDPSLDWWSLTPQALEVDYGEVYDLCTALTRFLLDRSKEPSFAKRIESISSMARSELLSLEASFHEWMESLDFLTPIETLSLQNDLESKQKAASLLLDLGKLGLKDVQNDRADGIAIALLAGETGYTAGEFLLNHRWQGISSSRIEFLTSSPEPNLRITGLALNSLRGKAPSKEDLESTLKAFEGRSFPARAWKILFPEKTGS